MKKGIEQFFAFLKRYIRACNKRKSFCFLRIRTALLIFLAVVFLEFLVLASFVGKFSLEHFLAAVVPETLVELTNIRREDDSIDKLETSPLLLEAAEMKAEDMAEKGYFAHTSPEGITPWYWFEAVGYKYKYAGENLAVNFSESEEVDEAWMESPSHRDNILNKNFEEIGIAVAQGDYKGREATFVVQLFGKKAEKENALAKEESLQLETEEKREVPVEENTQVTILGEESENLESEEESTLQKKETLPEKCSSSSDWVELFKPAENEESFAFIRKVGDTPTYIIGTPEEIIDTEEKPTKYITFWGKIISSFNTYKLYFLLLFSGVLFLSILLKIFLFKRINLSFLLLNEAVVFGVLLFALLTSHYVLLIAEYI